MSKLTAVRQFLENKQKQIQSENSVDSLVKRAQLAESGYDYQPKNRMLGLFGGGGQLVPNQQFGNPLPEGFVRVGGKVMKDPSYFNEDQYRTKSKIKAEEEAVAFDNIRKLTQSNDTSAIDAEIAAIREELNNMGNDNVGSANPLDEISKMTDEQLKALAYGG